MLRARRSNRPLRTAAALFAGAAALLGATIATAPAAAATPVQQPPAKEIKLSGAGATFPNPLYQRWLAEYQKVQPNVRLSYEAIGSGGGLKRIADKTAAFGASDAPLNAKQITDMGGDAAVIQFPTVAGGVVAAFNIEGVDKLTLSGPVIADMFLGIISSWDDPKIAALNPGVKLPKLTISPAWRSDGSGTTFVWSSYLSSQSEDFKKAIGAGTQVKWPVGNGGSGNKGVAQVVQSTPGAIGYVEHVYTIENKMSAAALVNKAGKTVKATPESISAAGAGAVEQLKGSVLAANIWDQPGEAAYPAAAFTYIIVYKDLGTTVQTKEEAQALLDFLRWTLTDGQKIAGEMQYAPLAEPVRQAALKALDSATFKGEKLASAGK